VSEASGFEAWFKQFREAHRGWEADQVKPWLRAAWEAGVWAQAEATDPALKDLRGQS